MFSPFFWRKTQPSFDRYVRVTALLSISLELRNKSLVVLKYANVQILKYAGVQIFKDASVQIYLISNSDLLAVFAFTLTLLLLLAFLALPNPAKSRDVRPLVRHNLRQLPHHQLCRLDNSLVHLFFVSHFEMFKVKCVVGTSSCFFFFNFANFLSSILLCSSAFRAFRSSVMILSSSTFSRSR